MRKRPKTGKGLLDKLINNLPVELHVPGYQYCGPGTKLEKRLIRGDPGKNELDSACKAHDIAYAKYCSGPERYKADKKLAREAWKRVVAKDTKIGERATALGVVATMRTKMSLSKTGGRLTKKKKKCFKKVIKRKKKWNESTILAAVNSAKKFKGGHKISHPRVIPIPKTGGLLPLIPIFAGLSALGALSGGVSNIVRTINQLRNARNELKENKYHNRRMEAIAIGRMGSGLYLKPYRSGLGLYLEPYSKNY